MANLFCCTNQSKHTELGNGIRKADTFLTRLFGLLPKSGLAPGEGLWIAPCTSIHSVGMRFLFDAVFVDGQYRVVHVIHAMKPMRISRVVFSAKSVLELPAGTLQATGTEVGDQLAFEASTGA